MDARALVEAGSERVAEAAPKPHPRVLGWLGVAALAIGGSNQSLFVIGSLIAGQGSIPGQWTAGIEILIGGFLLSLLAVPGWIELVLMSPARVGGIAAACSDAFRPYSPIISALAGVCYWWGWVPTCAAMAILFGAAVNQWLLPHLPAELVACALVVLCAALSLCGIKWVARLAVPIAIVSAGLAFVSIIAPTLAGHVDWHRAASFSLQVPFKGWFGGLTSVMAGLYLVGFGAPAFEAAACYVAETIDCNRNVPRAMLASAGMAGVYCVLAPVVWLGVLGATPLGQDLDKVLGPAFAPWFGAAAKSVAIGFMMLNMIHGTLQPLTGASRTLMQLSEDGLLPAVLARRLLHTDAPWVATLVTCGFGVLFVLMNAPLWLLAAANFTYLIGIGLPSLAVWLLRRDAPAAPRPWRAPRGAITLGLVAASAWGLSALFGFEQFGLPTVVAGLVMAYSGAAMYALRVIEERRRHGKSGFVPSLHVKLTGAVLLVLGLDAIGYFIAVARLPATDAQLLAVLADIFVAVAILMVTVGIVLPGMIAHSAGTVSEAARRLATGTVRDLSKAMAALGRGDLTGEQVAIDIVPVPVTSGDELGQMGACFNELQQELKQVAEGMTQAREGLTVARDDLIKARDAAEAGARAKTDFLTVVSHELRTPLNGVIGMASLLVDSDLSPQSRRYAETLRDAGDHLLQLINDVLDFSKLDAGKLELESVAFNLETLIHHTLEILAPRAYAKGVDIGTFIAPNVPKMVFGDPGRIRQVLMNLIGNAIKFTDHGTVSVDVSRLPGPASEVNVSFAVRDTGIGIPADKLQDLFQEFSQVDTSMSRRYGGTGLGLAISRKLVEKMAGEISAESEFGKGSVFRFSARLRPSARAATGPETAGQLVGKWFLVVDDTQMNRDMMARQIASFGGKAIVVNGAKEALQSLHHAAENNTPFDTVLIDHFMPVTDGTALAEQIRADGGLPPQRLVLATSAHFDAQTLAETEQLFDAVVSKPISAGDLLKVLMQERRPLPGAVAPLEAGTGKQKRVLVAEDNVTNQMVVCAMLERLGYRVNVVSDGAEALRAVQALPYDVVVMDIMMPEMDGVEATRAIRALPTAVASVPILGLTAHASPEDHALYRMAGMNDVMSKPITKQVLAATLAANLGAG